jgi:glycosyltransferase involved in cell wall biosynthesis
MKKYQPYNIVHINLAKHPGMPQLNTGKQGNYLVFWWNEIALGDLYIVPGITFTESEYYNKLIKSIKASVEYYSTKNNTETNWQQWISDNDFKEWSIWMNTIFSEPIVPEKTEVTVIICTRNRAVQLYNCLTALQHLHCLAAEIIVVDNAPADASTEEVVTQFKNVLYVREARPGLDIARNTGIKNASKPIVAFVDDDVTVHPLLIYNIWKTFENEDVAAMTGLVIAGELLTEAQYIFEKYWSFNRGYVDKIYDSIYYEKTLKAGPPVWEIGAGANTAFRKNIFEKVGYFDERLDVGAAGCNGDSEMWYRILAAGETIHYNPRAIVYHEHRREMAQLKRQLFYYMRGFAAAAMIQQKQNNKAGYKHHLYTGLPRYYIKLFKRGFPWYRLRYCSLWDEVKGVISGLRFYYKNKNPVNQVS